MIEIRFAYRYQSTPYQVIVAWPQVPRIGERVSIRHEPGMKLVYAIHSVDWIWDEDDKPPLYAAVLLS